MTTTQDDFINIKSWIRILISSWKSLFFFPLCAAILMAGYSLTLKNQYRADASILPISPSDSSGLLSQGGGGAISLTSLIGALTGSTYSGASTLLAILQSRSLNELIIQKHNLLQVLYADLWDAREHKWKVDAAKVPSTQVAAKLLQKKHVQFEQDKLLPVLRIKVTFEDPDLASEVANSYLKELQKFINQKSLNVSKRNRQFVEEQLSDAKQSVLEAGKNLTNFYKNNRVSDERSTMDVTIPGVRENGELRVPPHQLREIPQKVYYNYLQMQNEVLTNVVNLLSTQLEVSKIEESKQALSFQIIDDAVSPVQKYGPNRALLVMGAFLATLILTSIANLSFSTTNRQK